jgi:hypothetical protein
LLLEQIGTTGTIFARHRIGACGRTRTHRHCGALGTKVAQSQRESSDPIASYPHIGACELFFAQIITGTTGPTIPQLRIGSSITLLAPSHSEQLSNYLSSASRLWHLCYPGTRYISETMNRGSREVDYEQRIRPQTSRDAKKSPGARARAEQLQSTFISKASYSFAGVR